MHRFLSGFFLKMHRFLSGFFLKMHRFLSGFNIVNFLTTCECNSCEWAVVDYRGFLKMHRFLSHFAVDSVLIVFHEGRCFLFFLECLI